MIGFLISKKFPTKTGFYVGIFIALIGLIIGIVWATKIWKKGGTMEFISKVSSKPEFDKLKD